MYILTNPWVICIKNVQFKPTTFEVLTQLQLSILKGVIFMKRTFLYYLSFIFLSLGSIIYLILIFNSAFNDFSFKINPQLASNLGSTIAGLVGSLFSLTGILLIVETLISQNSMFKIQHSMFKIQQFETKYFELVKIHRDNVNNLQKLVSSGSTWTGGQVFVEIYNELELILLVIGSLCETFSLKLNDMDKGGIAYTILYFGIGDKSNRIVRDYFKRNYNAVSDKQVTWIITELQKLKQTAKNGHRFVGHQIRLGHYYRHLFQSVKYVDDQEYLNESEKYAYIKTLRAQLTTFEESLLFFNSLSVLGKNWRNDKSNLIETYQLIKNLPPEFTFKINPKSIYSKITFEYEE